jgi:hypothetical protein
MLSVFRLPEIDDRDGIAVDVAQPAQGRRRPDVEARFDDVHVMALARPQHRAMSAERDRLPVMVLRVVDDADALHGAVASGMMTTSSRLIGERGRQHYCMIRGECEGSTASMRQCFCAAITLRRRARRGRS